ncbi:MAG: polyprenol monophosphomannose synthase [Candidatus Schekmanbacteria bacterium]|nr:polyprenol monophosphomannose synthase [Candidatus Schekmanbacteria bacterium]
MAAAIGRLGYGLIVVDDASPDGTGAVADRLAASLPGIEVVHRARKEGLGPAYGAGFRRALERGPQIVCAMDCDFSHDPAELPGLVAEIVAGADIAIGSRYVAGGRIAGWRAYRRFLSWAGNLYARITLGLEQRDVTSGFRAFRAPALRRLEPHTCESAGYNFQVEMAMRAHDAGFHVVERPITFRDRSLGRSKMTPGIALEAMARLTRWALDRRLRRRRREEQQRA